jgi:glycosyl transferase family 4
MKWCFFSPGYRSIHVLGGDTRTTGGAEAQVAYLAAALARLGHEVGLIYGDGRMRQDRKVVAGITCIDAAPAWHPASLARFWRAMNFLSPDVLYARLPSDFLWVAGLLVRAAGMRASYSVTLTTIPALIMRV